MDMWTTPTPWERVEILEDQIQECYRMIQQLANNSADLAQGLSIQQQHLVEVNKSLFAVQRQLQDINHG